MLQGLCNPSTPRGAHSHTGEQVKKTGGGAWPGANQDGCFGFRLLLLPAISFQFCIDFGAIHEAERQI